MTIPSVFATKEQAKAAGWFSRRHQTSDEHIKARNKRLEKLNKDVDKATQDVDKRIQT